MLQRSRADLIVRARCMLPNDVFDNFIERSNNNFNKLFKAIRQNNRRKLKYLSADTSSLKLDTHNKFLLNYTTLDLPEPVRLILSAGPQFSIPFKSVKPPIAPFIKDLEFCLNNQPTLTVRDKDIIRARSVNVINNFYAGLSRFNRLSPLECSFFFTRKFLRDHPEILVTRSDKGNSTVITYKTEYVQHMKAMLEDSTTYAILPSDPTQKYQKSANNLIQELLDTEIIEPGYARKLKRHNSVIPKMYGLRKTHKPNVCYRPVVSCVDSPIYNLACFVHDTLAPLASTFTYNIKNSLEFVQFARTVSLPPDYMLVSLDIVSLFTNVPKQLVQDIIKKNWSVISAYTEIPFRLFNNIIVHIFETSYFTFDGIIYKQLDGTAMGNPASPILANLVVNEVIFVVLNTLSFRVEFLKLYVDDTIAAIPKNATSELLDKFNGFHHKLKFTMELEVDQKINFLDLTVMRNSNGSICTNWYTKPTASGRILNYFSEHSTVQKVGIIKNLMFRAYSLSDVDFHRINEVVIKKLLRDNNYPINWVNRIMNNYRHRLNNRTPTISRGEQTAKSSHIALPYVRGLSENICRILRDKIPEVSCAFYPVRKVGEIFSKIKDSTPNMYRSNVVYRIECGGCDKCYIGMTKQYLKNRLYQHEYDCRLSNKYKNDKTALADHHFQTGHLFGFEDVKVVDFERNYFKRCVSEMINIYMNNTVNLRTDIQNLSAIYANVLENYG
ncbi:uncharacterized protein LOC123314576 [Coccinella septempunctata]|uniref:uncharacterized protein LOC123314576 n=1 Tax=Coccinella septempunctata TaxID=41139 RepID=UPI001D0972A0|nr:uncharacterized protein LOC123314576 [Coccinella septempunctata]